MAAALWRFIHPDLAAFNPTACWTPSPPGTGRARIALTTPAKTALLTPAAEDG